MRRLHVFIVAWAALVGVSCGGDGGSGSSDPTVPRLSNASLTFSSDSTLQKACRDLETDAAYVLRADFSGDVVGGTLNLVGRFKPSGVSSSIQHDIPTKDKITVVLIGTDVVEFRDCVTMGNAKSLTLEAWVVSPNGVEGNHVAPKLVFP